MTTHDEARETLEQRFKTDWGTTTVYTLENEKFTQPGADVSWVRMVVRDFGGGQFTLGPPGERKYQRVGMIIMQLFSPLIRGSRGGSIHAQALRAIFEGKRIGDVYCWDGRVQDIGPDGKHYQQNVEVDVTYEERK